MSDMFRNNANLALHGAAICAGPLQRELAPSNGGFVPCGEPDVAAAVWSMRTGRPCPVTVRWCSCGHATPRQGKPIHRCALCGGFCEGSVWR